MHSYRDYPSEQTEQGINPFLFELVQLLRLFDDSKTFPDARPLFEVSDINREFARLFIAAFQNGSFNVSEIKLRLRQFVEQHFEIPISEDLPLVRVEFTDYLQNHIWERIVRQPNVQDSGSSRLWQPHSFVVPGGRFRESYYWDNFFTALGFEASGRLEMLESLIHNFRYQIETFGFIPNGMRSYYLTRSQPPFFTCMLQLHTQLTGEPIDARCLDAVKQEYQFWMDHSSPDISSRESSVGLRTVAVGSLALNRYFDSSTDPRPEGFYEDWILMSQSSDPHQLCRDLRAACESGWDFSSRWLSNPEDLGSIRTTQLLPVDLNCLLWNMEQFLGYEEAANNRREAITEIFWDPDRQWFFDYSWVSQSRTTVWSLAGVFPLFVGVASNEQAEGVASAIERHFLMPGGLVSTLTQNSSQQWDQNGWAPLQYIAFRGLLNYGYTDLAREIATRFLRTVKSVYDQTGTVMEKYSVTNPEQIAGGGEYENQPHFAWTAGVALTFSQWLSLND